MPEEKARGTDPTGRRSKRTLSLSEEYAIWRQLVRQEFPMAEAAAHWQVDRSRIAIVVAHMPESAQAGV